MAGGWKFLEVLGSNLTSSSNHHALLTVFSTDRMLRDFSLFLPTYMRDLTPPCLSAPSAYIPRTWSLNYTGNIETGASQIAFPLFFLYGSAF